MSSLDGQYQGTTTVLAYLDLFSYPKYSTIEAIIGSES